MGARVGAIVGLYMDTPRELEENQVIRTTSGRCYRIVELRRQARGKHAGRWHIKGLVLGALPDEQLESEDVVPLAWYRR
jgi:translation elongation factor P/translation initiation factor 5A